MKEAAVQNIGYKRISPFEAKDKLDNLKDTILLDVRTQREYMQAHIPRSILIPLNVLEEEAGAKLAQKDATIIVYCRSGARSRSAAKLLIGMGYTNVYDLGGIIDWPYDVEIKR